MEQILNKKNELFRLIHRREMDIFLAFAIEKYSDLDPWDLNKILWYPTNLKPVFFELQGYFLLRLIEKQNILVNSEVDTDVNVISLGLLEFAFETLVL